MSSDWIATSLHAAKVPFPPICSEGAVPDHNCVTSSLSLSSKNMVQLPNEEWKSWGLPSGMGTWVANNAMLVGRQARRSIPSPPQMLENMRICHLSFNLVSCSHWRYSKIQMYCFVTTDKFDVIHDAYLAL